MAILALKSLVSSATNDPYEKQLSLIQNIENTESKHGWDAYDPETKIPYEFKPTRQTFKKIILYI